jgi:hypothetical protein
MSNKPQIETKKERHLSRYEIKDQQRKSDVEKYLQQNRRVSRPSLREEERVRSLLHPTNYEFAAWKRYASIQQLASGISESVALKLDTDIPLSEDFFYYLLESMEVPSKITRFPDNTDLEKRERQRRHGKFDSLFSDYQIGDHQIKHAKDPKKFKRDVYCGTFSFPPECKDLIQEISTIEKNNPSYRFKHLLKHHKNGLSYDCAAIQNPNPHINLEIKFFLQLPSEPLKVPFEISKIEEYYRREAVLNIHLTSNDGVRFRDGSPSQCSDMASLQRMIIHRLQSFSMCYVNKEHYLLESIHDLNYNSRDGAFAYEMRHSSKEGGKRRRPSHYYYKPLRLDANHPIARTPLVASTSSVATAALSSNISTTGSLSSSSSSSSGGAATRSGGSLSSSSSSSRHASSTAASTSTSSRSTTGNLMSSSSSDLVSNSTRVGAEQSVLWNTLKLKHARKQNAKSFTDREKERSQIINDIIPKLIVNVDAICSVLTLNEALNIINAYAVDLKSSSAFQILKAELTSMIALTEKGSSAASSAQLAGIASGSAATVGAGIRSIAAAVTTTPASIDPPKFREVWVAACIASDHKRFSDALLVIISEKQDQNLVDYLKKKCGPSLQQKNRCMSYFQQYAEKNPGYVVPDFAEVSKLTVSASI